jgi:hypothetical protein
VTGPRGVLIVRTFGVPVDAGQTGPRGSRTCRAPRPRAGSVERQARTADQLQRVVGAAGGVTADEVAVVLLELQRPACGSGQDAVPEPRGEALDLVLDRVGHVDGGAVGDVAVGPGDVPALGCPRRIEQRRLCEDDERSLRVPSPCDRRFGRADLVRVPTDVDRACTRDSSFAHGIGASRA